MFLNSLQISHQSSVQFFYLGVLGSDLFAAPINLACLSLQILDFLLVFADLLGEFVVLALAIAFGS